MRRATRWAGFALGGIAVLLSLLVLGIYVGSEAIYARKYDPPAASALHLNSALPAEGERLAAVYGCSDCHGKDLRGRLFHDEPKLARLYAPNLTRVAESYSDSEFDAAVRYGIAKDGRGLWVMPSSAFSRLTPQELSAILAYLRSQPPGGPEQPQSQMGPLARIGIVTGKFRSEAALIGKAREQQPLFVALPVERGRHIAAVACAECHGLSLQGGAGPLPAPDLTIAAAYDLDEFKRLMHTGVAAGDRDLGLMSQVARNRFARLAEDEVEQLHAYLRARAEALTAEAADR
jgi:mono/diheme cytochrome c family protein